VDQQRTEFGFPRTTCSCSACANNCRNLPGMLIPDDVARIARHLGYTDVMEFSRENLLASPGAIVLRDNQQVRIPTLVPQRGADGACKFLQNDLCTIHSVSPYGCAFFSEHEPRTVGDKKSILGLIHITRDHQTNGRYSRIWSMLDSTNLKAIPPEAIRQRMRETSNSLSNSQPLPRASKPAAEPKHSGP
jgi:Fe-S-cluster containining protein